MTLGDGPGAVITLPCCSPDRVSGSNVRENGASLSTETPSLPSTESLRAAPSPNSPLGEVPALILARTGSIVGDQLARVALTALVLDRTGSPLLAALTFAATFLPAVLGTALLSGAADRLPRRRLLVLGDLTRGVLVLLMTLPGLGVPGVTLLALLVTLIDGPYGAARSALLRQLSRDDEHYQRATALDETATQSGQVAGYVLGGVAVATLGIQACLLINTLTFAASAGLVLAAVRQRPAAVAAPGPALHRADVLQGWRVVTSAACRRPVLLTWIGVGAAIAPEALALAWARDLNVGPAGAGVLLAANPVGGVAGLLLLSCTTPQQARRLLLPGVGLALVPLLLCATQLPFLAAVLVVALSGLGLTYSTIARIAFSAVVPNSLRGRAFGVAGTGVIVSQGLGIAAAGALTQWLRPGTAIAVCAGVGLAAAALLLVRTTSQHQDTTTSTP